MATTMGELNSLRHDTDTVTEPSTPATIVIGSCISFCRTSSRKDKLDNLISPTNHVPVAPESNRRQGLRKRWTSAAALAKIISRAGQGVTTGAGEESGRGSGRGREGINASTSNWWRKQHTIPEGYLESRLVQVLYIRSEYFGQRPKSCPLHDTGSRWG